MSWTDLPATNATDWSHVDFVNQFRLAYAERRYIIEQSGAQTPTGYSDPGALSPTTASVGTDVQSAAFWAELQDNLEQLCEAYIDADTPFSGRAAETGGTLRPWFENNIVNWLDAATTRTKAGLDVAGFTRKYPDGMGGVTTDHGLMQAGDYIGPWIFNELQAFIQQLTVTLRRNSGSYDAGASGSTDGSVTPYDDAYDNFVDNYATGASTVDNAYRVANDLLPNMTNVYDITGQKADKTSDEALLSWGGPDQYNRTAELFVYVSVREGGTGNPDPKNIYHDFTDTGFADGSVTSMAGPTSPSDGDEPVSIPSQTTVATPPPQLSAPPSDETWVYWQEFVWTYLYRWDVTGGFDYQ